MKKFVILAAFAIVLSSCGAEPAMEISRVEPAEAEIVAGDSPAETENITEEGTEMSIPQTGWTVAVPAEYTSPADEQGMIEQLDYASKDYVRDGSDITKTAYVYTPYGYDESGDEQYNILYLMHGWGGRAGEYFDFAATKNMFDNLIEKGDIPPIIIVSATFYNENGRRGVDK